MTLEEGLHVKAIWDKLWSNTKRSPAELREAALKELTGRDVPARPAASFW